MIITNSKDLRNKCSSVLLDEIPEIRSKLEFELTQSALLGRPGIGLAAPQIGIDKTFAIVRIPSSNGLIKIDLVNPTIEKFYDPIWTEEGCLSFPNLLVKTQRYNEIVAKIDVWPYRFIATGLLAICCQHEIDHFNGKKLLIDWKK